MRYDILLHPEQYRLEMTIRIDGLTQSHRTYAFRAVREGTRLSIEDEYEPIAVLASMMSALGMLRKTLVRDTTLTLQAFLEVPKNGMEQLANLETDPQYQRESDRFCLRQRRLTPPRNPSERQRLI